VLRIVGMYWVRERTSKERGREELFDRIGA